MYGMVNQAVKALVEENFGAEAWRTIHTKAGAPESFTAMQPYDDAVTYNLVAAASEALKMPPADVLRAFGEYWVLKVATVQYTTLMASCGRDLLEFLRNLDHMHERIRVTFPTYQPPSFRVKPLEAGLVQVDYFSQREGLMPFVEGLFLGLGRYFEVSLTMEPVPDEAHSMPCKRMLVRYGAAA